LGKQGSEPTYTYRPAHLPLPACLPARPPARLPACLPTYPPCVSAVYVHIIILVSVEDCEASSRSILCSVSNALQEQSLHCTGVSQGIQGSLAVACCPLDMAEVSPCTDRKRCKRLLYLLDDHDRHRLSCHVHLVRHHVFGSQLKWRQHASSSLVLTSSECELDRQAQSAVRVVPQGMVAKATTDGG